MLGESALGPNWRDIIVSMTGGAADPDTLIALAAKVRGQDTQAAPQTPALAPASALEAGQPSATGE
ncbi:hypothetical protein [Roseospira navarrensis]|uniref:Uncharacterized protein n=1 Tax=Roseospira navarrensis TaxID=140058 RepID=A0A7X2D305_9PROT|nr:hypothetical protein [Roseospira navarrensis]MQX36804.1 hypothetical protein [Roseospira navarrensis]